MRMATARNRLATAWFAGAGTLMILLVLQSILGKYGDKADEAWSWYLPTVLPTLSLVFGLFAFRIRGAAVSSRQVDKASYRLALGSSLGYLLLVGLSIGLSPLAESGPLQLMRTSNLWLAPFQGLACALVGAFFVPRAQAAQAAQAASP